MQQSCNNGAVPTEVTAAEGSMFQFGCFYDTQLGTIRFNSDRTSVAKKGQGICAWRFPTSVHYEIMADDMRTCDEIGDHVIASKTECLQAAISEQPNRGGSYKVQEASNVFPYGCSFSGTGQAMFNGEATSGRGLQFVQSSTGELIPNPALTAPLRASRAQVAEPPQHALARGKRVLGGTFWGLRKGQRRSQTRG